MNNIAHKTSKIVVGLGLSFAVLATQTHAEYAEANAGKWRPGMTAVFSGFLCHAPVDAVHGLVAALTLSGESTLQESQKVEEPLHCFFSDAVTFRGRIPNSKVFVDPEKGRFLFVEFDIGGGVSAYSWIGESYLADPDEVGGSDA